MLNGSWINKLIQQYKLSFYVMAYATHEYQLNKLDCVFKSVVSANFSVLETFINSKLAILKKHPTILL